MNLFQRGLCAVALTAALATTEVSAKDAGAATGQDASCNFLCELRDYLGKDHMVAEGRQQAEKAMARTKAPRTAPRPTVAEKPAASKGRQIAVEAPAAAKPRAGPKPQVVAAPRPMPRPRIMAQARPQRAARSARIVAAGQQSAAWVPSPIPGSAPTVTSDFAPAR